MVIPLFSFLWPALVNRCVWPCFRAEITEAILQLKNNGLIIIVSVLTTEGKHYVLPAMRRQSRRGFEVL